VVSVFTLSPPVRGIYPYGMQGPVCMCKVVGLGDLTAIAR
jgi:hypothetical protein